MSRGVDDVSALWLKNGVAGQVDHLRFSLVGNVPEAALRHHNPRQGTRCVYYLHAAKCEGIRPERGPYSATRHQLAEGVSM